MTDDERDDMPGEPEWFDQVKAVLMQQQDRGLARDMDGLTGLLSAFWLGLVEKGIPPEAATQITRAFITSATFTGDKNRVS